MLDKVIIDDNHGGFQNGKGRVNTEHKQVDKQQADPMNAAWQLSKNYRPGSCAIQNRKQKVR